MQDAPATVNERRNTLMEQNGPRRATARPVTRAWLERAAQYYLARYSSSTENLRKVLLRKAHRRGGPEGDREEAARLVEEVVAAASRMGLVDDARYAEGKAAALLRRGTATGRVKAALAAKGIAPDAVEAALGRSGADDVEAARRYAMRRRLGPWRAVPDPGRRAKDIAAMARAGFGYGIAAKIIDGPAED